MNSSRLAAAALLCVIAFITGCAPSSARLSFPTSSLRSDSSIQWFDVNHNGRPDFAITFDDAGRVDQLCYDDDEDGVIDRRYRPTDYANEKVPHLILLLDSIPFQTVADRYAAGDFRWCDPPQKMIAPFPSLTEICYSDILGAPPLAGVVDSYFDPRVNRRTDLMWERIYGYEEPWERRVNYKMGFSELGISFLHPEKWFAAELPEAKKTVDASPNRVTVVYIASAASMVCKDGKAGAETVLDGVRQLCLQLLYERCGAIKISIMADHGHNYCVTKNLPVAKWMTAAGFHVGDSIKHDDDAVLELYGLVTVAGVHTKKPDAVAAALVSHPEIAQAVYMRQADTIVRDAKGCAAIQIKNGKLRYVPMDGDPLGYKPIIADLQTKGLVDTDGYATDDVWFNQTLDHEYPNAPRRLWDATHGKVVNVPTVLFTTRDGYSAGDPDFEKWIVMQSTHGSLNQINSATFVMTMTGRVHGAVRHEDVLNVIEPGSKLTVKKN